MEKKRTLFFHESQLKATKNILDEAGLKWTIVYRKHLFCVFVIAKEKAVL